MQRVTQGNLIQLQSWLGDVWAEVVAASNCAETGDLVYSYVRYDTMGNRRWVEQARLSEIRASKDVSSLTKREQRTGSIHLQRGRFGASIRGWDWPVSMSRLPSKHSPEHYLRLHKLRTAC